MGLEKRSGKADTNLVLYDSTCSFCTSIIGRLRKTNKDPGLKFFPVQDSLSRQHLRLRKISFVKLNTIYFIEGKTVHTKSVAIFKILKKQQFPYNCFWLLSFFPGKISDFIYDLIAQNRHKFRFSGTKSTAN